jgi:23S rRNA G2069 N7-methylase RlmK/C1962 C5-methylase RlmI
MRKVKVPKTTDVCKYLIKQPSISGWVYDDYEGCFVINFYRTTMNKTKDNIVKEIEEKFKED